MSRSWVKPEIRTEQGHHFSSQYDAWITASGAAEAALSGVGDLAREAWVIIFQAVAFIRRSKKK